MPANRQRIVGLTAAIVAVVLFSLSPLAIKWPGIPGSTIAWWRLIGSSVLWWALLLVLRQAKGRPLPTARDWRIVAPGAVMFGINLSIMFLAFTRTSVVHATLIGSLTPLLLIPAGFVFFGERPYWRALGWGGVSLLGLFIVLTNGPNTDVATISGDIYAVIGLIAYAGYQIYSKRARLQGVDPFDFMAITMVIAVFSATPVALTTAGDQMWPLPVAGWVSVAILAIGTGMGAHVLLYFAQKSVPLGTLAVIQTSSPAQSAIWAWLFLGEAIARAQIPGLVLVMAGMTLVVWNSSRSPYIGDPTHAGLIEGDAKPQSEGTASAGR